MKKLLALALVAVLALSLFAACKVNVETASSGGNTPSGSGSSSSGGTGSASTPPVSSSSSTPDSSAAEETPSLISWMMGGTFSYDFTMTTEGPDVKFESSGSMAIDGDKYAMRQEMTMEGQKVKSWMISKDGKMYIIDEQSKTIMEMSVDTSSTQGTMTDYTGIRKTGSGVGKIGGKTLPYEEYAESETGGAVRYYIDGGQVYGIETQVEGYKTVMIITNPKNSVPAGMFDLPEGYSSMGVPGTSGGFDLSGYLPEGAELPEGFEMPEGFELPEGFQMP